ncbi:MAG: hypothetical protein GXP54_01065 [Deltaproteobacteria bacterium]|nr:hypothetical protein [Deltaproteobacteria bacterium]
MTRPLPIKVALLIATLLLSTACGGGGTPSQGLDINYFDIPGGEVPNADVQAEDADWPRDTDASVPLADKFEIILLHDTSVPLNLSVGESFKIHAKVIDYAQASVAPNVAVTYEITKSTDLLGTPVDPDATLGALVAYTDEYGLVHNSFSAGDAGGIIYTVTLSADNAEDKSIQFVVTEAPCGCINTTLDYEGGLPPSSLNTIKVHVLPSDYTCDKLHPEKPIPPVSLGDKTITDLYGTTQFECIPAGNYYTVFATAKGPFSCVAASGCDDGVFLQPDKCRDVALKLYLVTLNPTGQYDCTDHFDFTNLVKDCAGGITDPLECVTSSGIDLGKQVCCVLYQLITFFDTPGTTIINLVLDLAKQFIGSAIVDFFSFFADAVANVVTDYLLNNSPQWLQDFFKVGDDMMGIVTNLEMYSDLLMSKLQNDFTVQGTQYWTGLALYWKFGCNPSDPNYDECGKLVFSLDEAGNVISGATCEGVTFPLNILEGKFTASIADFNKLLINQHAIKLNYGKLVLFVLNEIVIANITSCQAHSVKDAAKLWFDCGSVASGILGQIASWFGGTEQDVENVCNKAIDFLLTPVDMFLGALTLDTELSLQGNGVLVDEDCDLLVDQITNGKYTGQVQTSAASQSAFSGTFEAFRK